MARTVVAFYDSFQTANEAVRDLIDNGFPRDNISIIANNARGEFAYGANTGANAITATPAVTPPAENETVADETGTGAGVGAGIGAAIGGIGGLLVGLGALTIPGIGPIIAAGPLAVALSTLTGAGVGAVAGGVTGGLLGALIGLGIPEEEAEYYAEGVRRGGVLVTIQAEEYNTDQIIDVLNRHDPIDLKQRAAQWRDQGWQGFNAAETQQAARSAGNQNLPDWSTEKTQMAHHDQALADAEKTQLSRSQSNQVAENGNHFDVDNPVYRNHYTTFLAESGYSYEDYMPAYQYGYGLANDARYKNQTWDVVEPQVRHDWELNHLGTYDRYQAAIRHAWEDASGVDRGY